MKDYSSHTISNQLRLRICNRVTYIPIHLFKGHNISKLGGGQGAALILSGHLLRHCACQPSIFWHVGPSCLGPGP